MAANICVLGRAEKVSDVHNLLIYCRFSATWASANTQQTQLTQCSCVSLVTSRGSSQPKFSVRVHHEFWRCPSPLEVAQRSWGKPGPWRQLLWMKLSIQEGRTNPPAFIYLLFFNRANRLQILLPAGVNWLKCLPPFRFCTSIIPIFKPQDLYVLSTQASNSPYNPEGITLRAKLAKPCHI